MFVLFQIHVNWGKINPLLIKIHLNPLQYLSIHMVLEWNEQGNVLTLQSPCLFDLVTKYAEHNWKPRTTSQFTSLKTRNAKVRCKSLWQPLHFKYQQHRSLGILKKTGKVSMASNPCNQFLWDAELLFQSTTVTSITLQDSTQTYTRNSNSYADTRLLRVHLARQNHAAYHFLLLGSSESTGYKRFKALVIIIGNRIQRWLRIRCSKPISMCF